MTIITMTKPNTPQTLSIKEYKMPLSIIGQLKSEILKSLTSEYVEFGHWVYIPSLQTLLSFKNQICLEICELS